MLYLRNMGLGLLVGLMAMQAGAVQAQDEAVADAAGSFELRTALLPSSNGELGLGYYINNDMKISGGIGLSVGEEFALDSFNVDVTYYLGDTGDARMFVGGGVHLSGLVGDVCVDDGMGGTVCGSPDLGVAIPLRFGAEYWWNSNLGISAWTGLDVAVTPDFTLGSASGGGAIHIRF